MKTIKNKEYSFNHYKQRLNERYNLNITKKEYNKRCSMVKKTFKLISIEKQKKDIQTIYIGEWKNISIKVVWSDYRKCLTTVLPKEEKYDRI